MTTDYASYPGPPIPRAVDAPGAAMAPHERRRAVRRLQNRIQWWESQKRDVAHLRAQLAALTTGDES